LYPYLFHNIDILRNYIFIISKNEIIAFFSTCMFNFVHIYMQLRNLNAYFFNFLKYKYIITYTPMHKLLTTTNIWK